MKKIITRLVLSLLFTFSFSILSLSFLKINKEIDAVARINTVSNNSLTIYFDKNSIKYDQDLSNKIIILEYSKFKILNNKEYLDNGNNYSVNVIVDRNLNKDIKDSYNIKVDIETTDMLIYILNNII